MVGIVALTPTVCSAGTAYPAKVTAAFNEDCEELIVRQCKKAKKEIYVAAYIFTNTAIVEALTDATARGVTVQVKMDRRQAESGFCERAINALRRDDVSVKTIEMPKGYHMHHKFIVIDGKVVLTGSYNYTVAATKENWENAVCIESPRIAAAYISEWRTIKSRSERKN